jgi:outer membrane protein assembly factor BamE
MHKHLILIFSSILLAACSGLQFPGVYKIDIPQGNIIEQEQVAQLKLGMTTEQVRFLLGTPLITDSYNPNRWDYTYSYRIGSNKPMAGETLRDRLSLHFENGLLARIDDSNPNRDANLLAPSKRNDDPEPEGKS